MCEVSPRSVQPFWRRFFKKDFQVNPIWLPNHLTYDIISTIRTFYVMSRSDGEKFVSIRQAGAEKDRTHILCGQTTRQTDRQTDPNAIPSPLSRVKMTRKVVSLFVFSTWLLVTSMAEGTAVPLMCPCRLELESCNSFRVPVISR